MRKGNFVHQRILLHRFSMLCVSRNAYKMIIFAHSKCKRYENRKIQGVALHKKGRKTAYRQGSQAVKVCHGKVLEAKLRGFETEGEKSQPQVGGVHP